MTPRFNWNAAAAPVYAASLLAVAIAIPRQATMSNSAMTVRQRNTHTSYRKHGVAIRMSIMGRRRRGSFLPARLFAASESNQRRNIVAEPTPIEIP